MRRHFFIFPAIMVMLAASAIYLNHLIGSILLGIWLLRIYRLKLPHFLVQNLFLLSAFGAVCALQQHVVQKRTLAPAENCMIRLKIYPDNLHFDGDHFSGRAKVLKSHAPVLFYGCFKPSRDLNRLRKNRKTIIINANVKVNRLQKPTNFNQFDAKRYFKSLGITNSLQINQVSQIRTINSLNVFNWIHNFRQGLLLKAQHLPNSLRLYTRGLLLGDSKVETDQELNGIKTLGLIHLFSISGFHVYYLMNCLELIFIYLHWTRERYRWIIIGFLPLYYLFAGASIGLLRSILMVEIGLHGRALKHHLGSLDVWSLALLLNLLIEPECLCQFGCQLSYALSLALIYTRKYPFWKQTIFMNLISLPFILFNLYDWHCLTIAANLLILPMFSIVILPIVIGGVVVSSMLPGFSQLADHGIRIFDAVLNWLSLLPEDVYFGKPNCILLILTMLFTLLFIAHPQKKGIFILAVFYGVMFVIIHFPLQGEVSYFDVGQGDSFLVREPFNRSVTVIDTGGKLNFGRSQNEAVHYAAEGTSINYLKSIGIHRVDNLCLSHQDADHCGDVPAFLKDLKVKNLLIPEGMEKNHNFMRRIEPNLGQTHLIPIKAGQHIPGLLLNIYHPFVSGRGDNHDSMVLGGHIGDKDWLFMGDLDQAGENEIRRHYPNLSTNVLKLGHHGSKTASGEGFLNQVHPQIAIISAGRHNRYHHPDPEVVSRIQKDHIRIYNTQKDGMISYRFTTQHGKWVVCRKQE